MGRQQGLLCRLCLTPSEPVGPQDGAATEDAGVREEKKDISKGGPSLLGQKEQPVQRPWCRARSG